VGERSADGEPGGRVRLQAGGELGLGLSSTGLGLGPKDL